MAATMRALLDTNIVVALFAGEPTVAEVVQQAEAVFLPVPVIGELYLGAFGSSRMSENLRKIESFAAAVAVLDCTARTARWYGEIKNELRAKGRPIPENDIWIAALAAEHKLTVVTRDTHFEQVSGIKLELISARN